MTVTFIPGQTLPASQLNAAFAEKLDVASYTPPQAPPAQTVTNVKDFGAVGDGSHDDMPAIRAAIGTGGRAVYFPPGTYAVSGVGAIVHSNTRIVGAGREVSVIKPIALTGFVYPDTQVDFPTVFYGYMYTVATPWGSHTLPPGTAYDTDISIEDLGFDFTVQPGIVASFMFVRNLMLAGIRLWATTGLNASCTGVRCLACDVVTLSDSIGENVMQMLDCWNGTSRILINNVAVTIFPGGGNGGVFNLQGVGTNDTPAHSWQYHATNINVQMNGGSVFFLDSQSGGSVTSDVLLENIMIIATGGSNEPIVGRGRGGRIKIHNMTCTALTGATWHTPILIGGFYSYMGIENGTNKISTVSGSNIITVTFTSGTDAGVGNYVSMALTAGGPIVANGLTLSGSYKILSIVSSANNRNNIVTCDARANANATGVITADVGIIGYQGSFHDCELNGITFDGASEALPLVSISGYGHQISNFNVTQNYGGSATPQYTTLFDTDITGEPDVTPRPIRFYNITAANGAGPVREGYSGDTFISYNPFTGPGAKPILGSEAAVA